MDSLVFLFPLGNLPKQLDHISGWLISTLNMEAVRPSETLLTIY